MMLSPKINRSQRRGKSPIAIGVRFEDAAANGDRNWNLRIPAQTRKGDTNEEGFHDFASNGVLGGISFGAKFGSHFVLSVRSTHWRGHKTSSRQFDIAHR